MKKNIILISLDTTRADVGYSGKFSGIEKLRKDGVTFTNTISSSPLTPVSHATVLTGLQPYNHGIRHLFKEKLKKNIKTISQILKSEGYSTGAIVSCPGMNKWYGFSKGFDHYDDEIPRLADGSDPLKTVDVKKRGTALKRASLVVERAKKWLKKNKSKNFFLFIHFFDAHWPYQAPKNFGGSNEYENEVAFTDHYLKIFLEWLEDNGIYNDTTIICFSDHGEDLGGLYPNDKGGSILGHPEEFGHGCLLYDQTQKVVLIIKDEQFPKGREFINQVRLVDIVATLLDILQIKYAPEEFDGISLRAIVESRVKCHLQGYSETFYPVEQTQATKKYTYSRNKKAFRIENRYKVIIHLDSDITEFYDLLKDPMEKNNLQSTIKIRERS
jgi:arylsulfatase